MQHALKQYQQLNRDGAVEGASNHRLIALLYQGALGELARARSAMAQGDLATKGQAMGKAISIIDGLRAVLDPGPDPTLAENLGALYGYCEQRLVQANLVNDPEVVQEVADLLRQISDAWAQIAPGPRSGQIAARPVATVAVAAHG